MTHYSVDFDKHFPPANSGGQNTQATWADALAPYLESMGAKNFQPYWCPTQLRLTNQEHQRHDLIPGKLGSIDYWMNSRVGGHSKRNLNFNAQTILFGDGNDGTVATNSHYSLSALPEGWRKNEKSPAYRHLGGANYAFADGHIKWLKPQEITDDSPRKLKPTFAIK